MGDGISPWAYDEETQATTVIWQVAAEFGAMMAQLREALPTVVWDALCVHPSVSELSEQRRRVAAALDSIHSHGPYDLDHCSFGWVRAPAVMWPSWDLTSDDTDLLFSPFIVWR